MKVLFAASDPRLNSTIIKTLKLFTTELKHCGLWVPKYGTFDQVISSCLPIFSCSKQISNRGSRIIVHVDYASPTMKAQDLSKVFLFVSLVVGLFCFLVVYS